MVKIYSVFLLILLAACAQNPSNFVDSEYYEITFDKSNPALVKVKAKLGVQDSLLYMSFNGSMFEHWKDYVRNLEIKDGNGNSVEFSPDSSGWVIQGEHNSLNLSYDIAVEHEKIRWSGGIDGVAFVRDWGVMCSGRSLFIMNGEVKNNIKVKFNLPDGWKVSSPWLSHGDEKNLRTVENLHELQESLIFAGTHEEFEVSRGSFSVVFALGGEGVSGQKEKYLNLAEKSLDYYTKIMGGIPDISGDNNQSRILVLINKGDEIDGEVIGKNISMFMNPEADPQNQIIGWFLYTHEFFHLWNGKSIKYEGTESDWFKEGITNYYALKAIDDASIADEGMIKSVLNNLFYNRYINDSALGKRAPAYTASGFDKHDHWGLVYGGGLFAGICIDMALRHESYNQISLDTVMKNLYTKYSGNEKFVNNETLLKEINSLTEQDFSTFFANYVTGSEIVPLQEYLKYAGVDVDTTNKSLTLKHKTNKTELEKNIWEGFLGRN
ncbi:MAG: hypothetical protein SCALA702_36880 [Melioribacteraceae bacterium]|nr:MAG: hypothetical protein SCALA702_36880 [Melioribacteraceae bacterium]